MRCRNITPTPDCILGVALLGNSCFILDFFPFTEETCSNAELITKPVILFAILYQQERNIQILRKISQIL